MKEIIIKNLNVFAYHGVHNEEKINGQNFYIDAICKISERVDSELSDNIKNTVSYSDIIKTIKKTMLVQPLNLIETVADVLCKKILEQFPKISEIELVLKKPEAPIDEKFDYVAVKISKKRNGSNL